MMDKEPALQYAQSILALGGTLPPYVSERLGTCEIVQIESFHAMVVKSASGKYYRVSGLSL
jgi:hypothetical protein